MATSTTTAKHPRYPRKLGRFINLEGGLYGSLDLVALSKDVLELQTGEDFVRFDHHQATNLRDSIDKFLADKHDGEEVEEVAVAEVVAETDVTRRASRRPRRRTR